MLSHKIEVICPIQLKPRCCIAAAVSVLFSLHLMVDEPRTSFSRAWFFYPSLPVSNLFMRKCGCLVLKWDFVYFLLIFFVSGEMTGNIYFTFPRLDCFLRFIWKIRSLIHLLISAASVLVRSYLISGALCWVLSGVVTVPYAVTLSLEKYLSLEISSALFMALLCWGLII